MLEHIEGTVIEKGEWKLNHCMVEPKGGTVQIKR